ncbi:MAG: hypothetical protein KDJ29_01980 [Hyphomicrobiales bacterium]|nr:hypothetical protein [Hyphomicrobiales bacterium]
MAEAIVIGAVLRVDLRGWSDPPPSLPNPPIKVEEGGQGTLTFHYDICPPDHDLTAGDLANRIYSRLDRIMVAEKSPFNSGPFARRFTVEIGLMYDGASERFATSWPADFLRVMGEADAELIVTHYAFTRGEEPLSEDDL